MFERLKSIFKIGKEKDELIKELLERIENLEENNALLIEELGELSSYCDKCDGSKFQYCLKCNGTGIVKKKTLLDWPWQ